MTNVPGAAGPTRPAGPPPHEASSSGSPPTASAAGIEHLAPAGDAHLIDRVLSTLRFHTEDPSIQESVKASLRSILNTASTDQLTACTDQNTTIQLVLQCRAQQPQADETPLSSLDLRGLDLRGANLSGSKLTGADLSGAILRSANLDGANLDGANLDGAKLTGANLSRAILTKATLNGASLSGSDLSGADLIEANLTGAILTGAILYRAYLSEANLSEANLSRADLTGAILHGVNLSGANLSRAILTEAILHGADLRGANLDGTNLDGVRWGTVLPETVLAVMAMATDDPNHLNWARECLSACRDIELDTNLELTSERQQKVTQALDAIDTIPHINKKNTLINLFQSLITLKNTPPSDHQSIKAAALLCALSERFTSLAYTLLATDPILSPEELSDLLVRLLTELQRNPLPQPTQ